METNRLELKIDSTLSTQEVAKRLRGAAFQWLPTCKTYKVLEVRPYRYDTEVSPTRRTMLSDANKIFIWPYRNGCQFNVTTETKAVASCVCIRKVQDTETGRLISVNNFTRELGIDRTNMAQYDGRNLDDFVKLYAE